MLGQRRRWWTNIEQVMGQHLVYLIIYDPWKPYIWTQRCFNAGPPSATLAQH